MQTPRHSSPTENDRAPKRAKQSAEETHLAEKEKGLSGPKLCVSVYMQDQIDHSTSIARTLEIYPVHYDNSGMGSGKSRGACGVASILGLGLAVVCPTTVSWKKDIEATKARQVGIMSYAGLRGTRASTNPWLKVKHSKYDPTLHSGDIRYISGPTTSFEVTDVFKKLVDDGILLVLDEAQAIKNDTRQSGACGVLVKYIIEQAAKRKPSRVLLLSGTPLDSMTQVNQLFNVMGLTDDDSWLWDAKINQFMPGKSNLLWRICANLDRQRFDEIKVKWPRRSDKELQEFLFELCAEIVMRHLASSLPLPKIPHSHNRKLAFYRLDSHDSKKIKNAMKEIEGQGKAQQQHLQRIHAAKVPACVRATKAELQSDPKRKVFICCIYYDTSDALKEELKEFSPLVLDGRITDNEARQNVIAAFNSGTCRVLIANTKVGGVGLNLGDTTGDSPRTQFIFPSYFITDMWQSMFRCYRRDTKSDVKVYLIFDRDSEDEVTMLERLASKEDVWSRLLPVQVQSGEKFLTRTERLYID